MVDKEQEPSPESREEKIARIQEQIDERDRIYNFHLYFLPDEELGEAQSLAYSLDADATHIADEVIGNSRHGDIIAAINEFREQNPEKFEETKEVAILYRQLSSVEQSEAKDWLENNHLKPVLKEMVPTLLDYNVNPFDLTA